MAGTVCNFSTQIKFFAGYDDSLDVGPLTSVSARKLTAPTQVFASHAVGGVVGNVDAPGSDAALWASSEKKTSAAPGAGTLIWHMFCVWSQGTVWMSSSPFQRPSAS